MDKSIGILDKDYSLWVDELVKRYRGSQIKAAIKVNKELLRYYWELGKDIEEKHADNKYGSKFYATLSFHNLWKDYTPICFQYLGGITAIS